MIIVVLFACVTISVGPALPQDADTLKLDGRTYRFDGIDAPEIDQLCLGAEGEVYPCGRVAAEALRRFVADRPIRCSDLRPDPAYAKRRIGQCSVDGIDLHRWLVQEGWALNYEPYAKGRFKTDEDDARAGHFGLWKGCFVAPQDFRHWKRTAKLLGANCSEGARERLFPNDPLMPAGCEIKGKYALRAYPSLGIYHLPGCGSYRRTVKSDRWFCSEDDALAAGFRKSYTCGWW